MLYKDLMTKETYDDFVDYLENDHDAITLMGYDNEIDIDAKGLITRFQTTADPMFIDSAMHHEKDVMIGVPRYTENGHSSFALRDKSLSLRCPIIGNYGAIKKYFGKDEEICPNFKSIIKDVENQFGVKVKDNEKLSTPSTVRGGTIRLAQNYNGQKLTEVDKLVVLFNLIAKESIKNQLSSNLSEREKFIIELTTTMFIAESYDMGFEFNRKVDNALRLQISNSIAALGNASSHTLKNIAFQTERAITRFLKVSKKSEYDIYKNLTKIGYRYKEEPTSLYQILFGERHNVMFNSPIPDKIGKKILGMFSGKTGSFGFEHTPKIESKSQFAGVLKEKEQQELLESTEKWLLAQGIEADIKNIDGQDVILLPGRTDKVEDINKEESEQDLDMSDYISAIDEQEDMETEEQPNYKKIFSGKMGEKQPVSEKSLKNAFDKVVVGEISKTCRELAKQCRTQKGEERKTTSEIFNQLTHAKQFFGKSSERKDIRTTSATIDEAKKVKIGLVKPLEERRKFFVAFANARQKELIGNLSEKEVKHIIKTLSDSQMISEMIEKYVQTQKNNGLEK